jgi:hypothetical protein
MRGEISFEVAREVAPAWRSSRGNGVLRRKLPLHSFSEDEPFVKTDCLAGVQYIKTVPSMLSTFYP